MISNNFVRFVFSLNLLVIKYHFILFKLFKNLRYPLRYLNNLINYKFCLYSFKTARAYARSLQ